LKTELIFRSNNKIENENQLGLLDFISALLSDEGEAIAHFFFALSQLFKGTPCRFSDNENVFEHNKSILRESLDGLIYDIVNFKLSDAKEWKRRTDKIIKEEREKKLKNGIYKNK